MKNPVGSFIDRWRGRQLARMDHRLNAYWAILEEYRAAIQAYENEMSDYKEKNQWEILAGFWHRRKGSQ